MENRINYMQQAELLKALGHPVRLQIVHGLLETGCRSVRCMELQTGVSQSSISQHLQKLRAVGAVLAERSGNQVYYRVSSPLVAALVEALTKEEAVAHVL